MGDFEMRPSADFVVGLRRIALLKDDPRIMDVCLNWYSRLSRSPTAATAPNALLKTSSPKGRRGRNSGRTFWRRPPLTFLTGRGLIEFVSTLSATRSYPWHETSSRRVGRGSC